MALLPGFRLAAAGTWSAARESFPNGCHIAEVEVDPETGVMDIVSYTSVDDCGIVLNDTIVSGQIHGGVAQGIGQAIGEHTVYDRDSGQLLSGSLMDYAMPRAGDVPRICRTLSCSAYMPYMPECM